MQADYAVYIGRFQPFTIAHEEMVKIALNEAEKVIIIIGSDKASLCVHNPFTTAERIKMIYSVMGKYRDRLIVIPMQDSAYNFSAWTIELQRKVNSIVPSGATVKLIGHEKDDSSYYLRHFPKWELVKVGSLHGGLSATEIREEIFNSIPHAPNAWKLNVPIQVDSFICNWMTEENYRYTNLIAERKAIQVSKDKWKNAPYTPIFVTTDAVVFMNSHILLIKRGNFPGKGQWALPGGYLEPNLTLNQNCLKELHEETNINVVDKVLRNSVVSKHEFDAPWRDPRGRTITHAYQFNLDNYLDDILPNVKAGDDACLAEWIPIGMLEAMEGEFFIDHLQIIKFFLGRSI